jgi:hypothetical protein
MKHSATQDIRRSRRVGALLATLVVSLLPLAASAQGGGIRFGPTPAWWILMDRSADLDYAFSTGDPISDAVSDPSNCNPAVDYTRTRRLMLSEALTGTLVDACAVNEGQVGDPTGRGVGEAPDHIGYVYTRSEYDGFLHLAAPFGLIGFATFDADTDPDAGPTGEYSAGASYSGWNLGVANRLDPYAGLVSPLPVGGFPERDGAEHAWRQWVTTAVRDRVMDIYPAGDSPIAAALEDIQEVRHNDPGVLSDPYAACRPHSLLLMSDGGDDWRDCSANGTCPNYDYPSLELIAENLATRGAPCRGCVGGISDYRVPTYVVGVATSESDDAAELALIAEHGGDTCALFDTNGVCIERVFAAENSHQLINSMAQLLNQLVAGTVAPVAPVTMRASVAGENAGDLARPGFFRFRGGAIFGDDPATGGVLESDAWPDGFLYRDLYYCDVDDSDPGNPVGVLVADEGELDMVAQFDEDHATSTTVPFYTQRLDYPSSCARPTCDFHDPVNCGDDLAWVAQTPFLVGSGVGGTVRGGADQTGDDDRPAQSVFVEALFEDYSDLSDARVGDTPSDIGEIAVCVFGSPDTTEIQSPQESEATVARNEGTIGTCAGTSVVCVDPAGTPVSTVVDDIDVPTYLSGGATLGVCFEPPDPNADVVEFCYYPDQTNADRRQTIEVTTSQASFLMGQNSLNTMGPCVAVTNVLSRSDVDAANRRERNATFWIGNDERAGITNPIDFEAVSTSCLAPLDVDTFGSHPEYFNVETDDHAEAVIRWLRGENLEALGTLVGTLPAFGTVEEAFDRPSDDYFPDIFHGTLAAVGRPNFTVARTLGYQNFIADHGDRRRMLYVPTNRGDLMAFDADTGAHLWSFVPGSFLPALAETMHARRPLLDGPVVVRDLVCGRDAGGIDEYCTLLALSYGAGGSGVTILDVTDPDAPGFVLELTGEDVPELGLSTTRTLLTQLVVDDGTTTQEQAVAVISGGVPAGGPQVVQGGRLTGESSGEVLVVLGVPEGRILRQFDPISNPDLFQSCGAVTSAPTTFSTRGPSTGIYAGTQYGCLLFLDTANPDPAQWTLSVLDRTSTPGMIRFTPTIAQRLESGRLTNVIVYTMGTAEFEQHPSRIQTLVSVNHSYVASTPVNPGDPVVLEAEGIDLVARPHVNFELAFEPGEVVTTAPYVYDGVLYFATWAPNDNLCQYGSARVWGIDYLGDPLEDGPINGYPYLVDVTEPRIVPALRNPDLEFDPDLEPIIPFVTSAMLAEPDPALRPSTPDASLVYSLTIDDVPTCQLTGGTQVPGHEQFSGETRRQLSVGMLRVADASSLSSGSEWSAANSTVESANLQLDLSHPQPAGRPLDWGSIRLY